MRKKLLRMVLVTQGFRYISPFMRLVWLTDIHSDKVSIPDLNSLFYRVAALHADAILIGGDTAENTGLEDILSSLRDATGLPIYFVLGNHDYYRGSIVGVQSMTRDLCDRVEGVTWLDRAGVVTLADGTQLVGVGGWGDVGFGDPETTCRMKDEILIEEFGRARGSYFELLSKLGQADAHALEMSLIGSVSAGCKVIVLTHVPPFVEAAHRFRGLSEPEWQPFTVCRATGEVLARTAARHAAARFLVLCGHTHYRGEYQHGENMRVVTGGSIYGRPIIQAVVDTDSFDLVTPPGEKMRLPKQCATH